MIGGICKIIKVLFFSEPYTDLQLTVLLKGGGCNLFIGGVGVVLIQGIGENEVKEKFM